MSAFSSSKIQVRQIANPKIGRDMNGTDQIILRVGCLNVACSNEDEKWKPLCDRIDKIINMIINLPFPLDCLVLTEAGRASGGRSFTSMASHIEERTGLTYMGIDYVSSRGSSFGKAVFIRRRKCMLINREHQWLDPYNDIVAGDHWGYDILTLDIAPVVEDYQLFNDGRPPEMFSLTLRNAVKRIAFVHFPMAEKSRLEGIDIVKHLNADVLMGDWNTFPQEGGPEMLAKMEDADWISILPKDVMTFKAFPHDICTKPASYAEKLNKESQIVSQNDDGTIGILFSSPLDHVFVKKDNPHVFAHVHHDHQASDHALVIAAFLVTKSTQPLLIVGPDQVGFFVGPDQVKLLSEAYDALSPEERDELLNRCSYSNSKSAQELVDDAPNQ